MRKERAVAETEERVEAEEVMEKGLSKISLQPIQKEKDARAFFLQQNL
jgi:hypothetical protein